MDGTHQVLAYTDDVTLLGDKIRGVGSLQSMMSNEYNTVGRNSYELLTNQNYIHGKIKFRLEAGNSCCYSAQTLLSSRLPFENFKIEI